MLWQPAKFGSPNTPFQLPLPPCCLWLEGWKANHSLSWSPLQPGVVKWHCSGQWIKAKSAGILGKAFAFLRRGYRAAGSASLAPPDLNKS